jgi:hypothetical protein
VFWCLCFCVFGIAPVTGAIPKSQTPKHLIWSKASRVLPNVSIKGWGKISVFVFLGLLHYLVYGLPLTVVVRNGKAKLVNFLTDNNTHMLLFI